MRKQTSDMLNVIAYNNRKGLAGLYMHEKVITPNGSRRTLCRTDVTSHWNAFSWTIMKSITELWRMKYNEILHPANCIILFHLTKRLRNTSYVIKGQSREVACDALLQLLAYTPISTASE